MKIIKFELENLLDDIKCLRAHLKTTGEKEAILINAQVNVLIGLQKYENEKSVKKIQKELGTF